MRNRMENEALGQEELRQLLLQIAAGDSTALAVLYDRCRTGVYAQAAVLSQTVPQEPRLEVFSREENLSLGKANLVWQLLEMKEDDADLGALSALSVEELYQLTTAREARIPIGREAARIAAETYAGTLGRDGVYAQTDAELDEQPACYEVELHTSGGKFEYIIDAFTGEVLRGQADILTSPGNVRPAPSPGLPQTVPVAPGVLIVPETPAPVQEIGEAQAQAIALSHAGLSASDVVGLRAQRDWDDGRLEYEVEFRAGLMEYEYSIDGYTGAILEFDQELD